MNRRAKSPAAIERQRLRVAAIVSAVRAADPWLDPAVVVQAVDQVASSPNSLARLADYLHQHPDSLCSGASAPPMVVGALIAVLVDAGSTVLVVPRCASCDRQVELLHTWGRNERICRACWQRQNTAECADCGRVRPVAARTSQGGARCAMCHNRTRAEACDGCGRLKQVARRNSDGTAHCSACLRRDTKTWEDCAGCGRRRPVNARTDTGAALCPACYTQPPETCDGCGQETTIVSRVDARPLCARCYRHPKRECGDCGRIRRVAVRGRDGQPDLCPTCHQAPVLVCGVCGVRDRCRTTTADRSPICFRCQLARRLDHVLADAHGHIPAPLAPLREAILAVDNPSTALGWLARSPAIKVVTAMATGDQPLSHATLDAAAGPRRGRAFAVEHLRELLVTCGALPKRDRHLARLELALDELINTTHPEDQHLLRTYATWRLLHRLRRKADQGQPTQAAAHRVRELTAESARFLAWLRGRSTPLAACTQGDLDTWLSLRPRARGHLVGFLRWAHTSRLMPALDAPYPRSSDPTWFVADDQRWNIARRALTDDTSPHATASRPSCCCSTASLPPASPG